ncbi:Abi family protein [Enterococcus casseliflavus]|uniref:Abi family protein n=1 Tax=Enterococcus casseliflavus TaxID=37734 RepID=UPI0034D19525
MEKDRSLYLNAKQVNPNVSFELDVRNVDFVRYQTPRLNKAVQEMKVPIAADQMIEKFIKDGWVFEKNEEDLCREFLKEINFYTLKYYAKGISSKSFNATKAVYDFDAFLQNSIQELTSIVEKFLRTLTVDSISWAYQQQADQEYDPAQFYLDESLYFSETGKHKRSGRREKEIAQVQYGFFKTIMENKEYPPVKKELDKYGGVSSWVLFDLITFGQLSFFFGKLTTKYKKIVVRELNEMNSFNEQCTDQLLSSWINAIRALRNKVSHGMKVYGEPFTVLATMHDGDKEFIATIDPSKQNHLVNTLFVMRRIIMCMSSEKHQVWNQKMIEIDERIKENDYLLFRELGLSEDWLNHFLIKKY